MILKAIEELGENGDSSEESISDLMKKQYKDLPWAHGTLLNHHLKILSASGEIVLTNNQTYVLPVLPSFDQSPKKSSQKKLDLDRNRCKKKNTKQKRQLGKDYMKQKKDKDDLMIADEPEGSQLNPKGQQLEAKAHLIAEHRPPCDSDEQALKKVHEMQVGDICSSDSKLSLKRKKLDDFQTDTCTPCFGSVLESINFPVNSQDFAVVVPELPCTTMEHVHSYVNDELKQVPSVPNQGENRAMTTQVELREVCNQQTIPELKSTTDDTSVSKSQPLHCSGADQVRRIVYQYKRRTPGKKRMENQTNKQQLEEFEPLEQEQVQKQLDELQPVTATTDIVLHQIECGENRAMLTQVELTEVCNQQTIPELNSTTDATSVSKSQPLHQGTRMKRKLRSWTNNSADDPRDMNHLSTEPTQTACGGAFNPVERHKEEIECQKLLGSIINGTPLMQEPQKSELCLRGRPSKFKHECDSAIKPSNTAEELPHSDSAHMEKKSDKPKRRGRGRPRKTETVALSVINESFASGIVPEYRGRRGRPRKIL